MMPNMVGSAIVFYGMQATGIIPAMINFTLGAENIISGCSTAKINTIYTSRKFIKKAELENVCIAVKDSGIKIIYLEDLRKFATIFLKIKSLIASFFPETYYNNICPKVDVTKTAVLLFTSGTEGKPKAVALSHQNIQSNRGQVMSRIDFNPYDTAFNALPLFHTFGLTGTLVMCTSGVKTFLYPSPLHYRIIPEVIYDISATIMFATDTFLSGYAKHAHPYDLYSLRYVIAGAEKLKPNTRNTWLDKFGIRILEGYGVTEASPIVSLNTPMHHKKGTVGRLMPKIEYFIQPVEGISEGGRLCVKGPNIMLGYMRSTNPGVIEPTKVNNLGDGWHDTGDIVSVDDERYIKILGREKRFAKIGGEMISLALVEEIVSVVDDTSIHASICIDDDRKGEQIILFTTSDNITREKISKAIKIRGSSELFIPKVIIKVKELPVLSTGKLNYREILQMARDHVEKQ
jgi:acyl-[acyl-carrier-protein]-phospholipid O-acyltransferase/long-chain-fatty-acid--[acyl-carrier-protein] ligase